MIAPYFTRPRSLLWSNACYKFDGYEVIHFITDPNVFWRFDMGAPFISSVGAYYRGSGLRIVEAANPALVGHVYKGFFDFTNPENFKHNTLDSWMNCVADKHMDWFCVHSEGIIKRIQLGHPDTCPVDMEKYVIDGELALFLGK